VQYLVAWEGFDGENTWEVRESDETTALGSPCAALVPAPGGTAAVPPPPIPRSPPPPHIYHHHTTLAALPAAAPRRTALTS